MISKKQDTTKHLNIFRNVKALKAMKKSITHFTNTLYEEDCKKLDTDNSSVLSPICVFLFLCNISNGAQEITREQMLTLLKVVPLFSNNLGVLNDIVWLVYKLLFFEADGLEKKFLLVHNIDNLVFHKQFLKLKEKYFQFMEIIKVPKSSKMIEKFDEICVNNVGSKIKKISMKENIYVLIQNLKVDVVWKYEFDEQKTVCGYKFKVFNENSAKKSKQSTIDVDMMEIEKLKCYYGEHDWKTVKFRSIILPMDNPKLYFLVLFFNQSGEPSVKQFNSLEESMRVFEDENYDDVFSKIRAEQKLTLIPHLKFPKFSVNNVEQRYSKLIPKGYKFYHLANINPNIEVIQKLTVNVDEKGIIKPIKPENKAKEQENVGEIIGEDITIDQPFLFFVNFTALQIPLLFGKFMSQ